MPETNTNIDVAVIGAGIIGVCIALELVERGLNVAIFDPAAVCSRQAMAMLALFRLGPASHRRCLTLEASSWMVNQAERAGLDPAGLFTALPSLGIEFLAAGKADRVDPIGNAMFALSKGSVDAYKQRLTGTGKVHLVRDSLYVHVYRDPAAASLDHLGWQMRQQRQVPIDCIGADDLRMIEPELADEFQAAIIIKRQGRASDPAGIGVALAEKAIARGTTHIQSQVKEIRPDNGQGCQVVTDRRTYQVGKIVLAAGIWSRQLLVNFGFNLPLRPSAGITCYFATLE